MAAQLTIRDIDTAAQLTGRAYSSYHKLRDDAAAGVFGKATQRRPGKRGSVCTYTQADVERAWGISLANEIDFIQQLRSGRSKKAEVFALRLSKAREEAIAEAVAKTTAEVVAAFIAHFKAKNFIIAELIPEQFALLPDQSTKPKSPAKPRRTRKKNGRH